jgi:hypothetical protein
MMSLPKKLLYGAALAFVAMQANAQAVWIPVATGGGGTEVRSIERGSIKRAGDLVSAWMRADFPVIQGPQGPYNRTVEHMKLDCFSDSYVSRSYQVYMDDTLLATVQSGDVMEIQPGKIMSGVEKALCHGS